MQPPAGDPGASDPAKRYDPTGGFVDLGARRFLADFADVDDATFREEVESHGFDAERMTLFRDIYLGRGSVKEIRERAEGLLGSYWAGQVHRAAEQAALTSDPDTRMKVLEEKLKIARTGR